MRFAMKHLRNQQGFTLLELLVVVAILAVVAGGLVVAYDGLESQAGKQEASHGLAALDDAMRIFTSIEGSAPNNLDSLLAATPATSAQVTNITQGSEVAVATLSKGKLDGKITPTPITAAQLSALNNAGITQARYIDLAGNQLSPNCPATEPCALTTLAADGTAATVQAIDLADIPVRIFDVPRPGNGRNRGRGYSSTIVAGDAVMTWNAGDGGINLTKVGAQAAGSQTGGTGNVADDDVLIAFGIGNNASMFTSDSLVGTANISAAPTYPDVARSEYARYVALYNVGTLNNPAGKARLQAVVDSKGDFLDEELAEASGQKS